jgi:peroxin-1
MLANAVAKECGLNFMSVKGPELLNKCILALIRRGERWGYGKGGMPS